MDIRIKNAAGTVMLLSGLPAFAQDAATLKATAPVSCASCPPPAAVTIPGDPTWFVAGAIVGAAVGFLAAKILGGKKAQ